MTTFSQLVDDMVLELKRPDLLKDGSIPAYVNQSIRDVHNRPNLNVPIKYDANREEDEITTNATNPWLWSIPSATRFMDLETAYWVEGGIYVPKKNPRVTREFTFEPFADLYWYRSGSQLAFSGIPIANTVQLSYWLYPRVLAYQEPTVAARPIVYDILTDSYVFADGTPGTPTETQLETCTNWVLQRWPDTIKEGVRAKTWKRLGDMDRTRTAFSSFESGRTVIWNSEPSSS
jgi:hypothetical protein